MTDADTHGEFVRYLVAGATNTLVTYGLLVLAMRFVNYLVAYTACYATGIALGYALQSLFVFRVPLQWRTVVRFPLAYVVQYAFGAALLSLLVDVGHVDRRLSALIVVVANVPVGFIVNRRALRHPRLST